MTVPLITLGRDELVKAAKVFETHTAEGHTAVAAMAYAVMAVNGLRSEQNCTGVPRFRALDCLDCLLPDGTCPGHPNHLKGQPAHGN